MDYKQLLRDVFTLNFRSMGVRFDKLRSIVLRRTVGENINKVSALEIPVVINNRNRFSYLLELIAWLENAGMKNIIILDNDSTYLPLLAYYATTKHRVVKLNANVGHLAFWKSSLYDELKSRHYIYSDPDVVPAVNCPTDMVAHLVAQLAKYTTVDKIGLGLKIDDLPDEYANKQQVIEWERKFWERQVAPGIYDAAVDTTFALYRPYTNGARWVASAYRTGEPYVAYHKPWYENTQSPGEENEYYAKHARQGASHWTNKTS